MRIEKADLPILDDLNSLIVRSKSHWNYDPAYLHGSLPFIRLSPAWIQKHQAYAIYSDEGQLVGVMGVQSNGVNAYLEHFWIDPGMINQGFGKKAMSWLLESLKDARCSRLNLLPDPPAEGFYSKLGFSFTGREVPSRLDNGPVFKEMSITIE